LNVEGATIKMLPPSRRVLEFIVSSTKKFKFHKNRAVWDQTMLPATREVKAARPS